jgi:hypothetical protein
MERIQNNGLRRKPKSDDDGLIGEQEGNLDRTQVAPAPVEMMTQMAHPMIVALKPNLSRHCVKIGGRIAPKSPPIPHLRKR